MTFIQWYRRKRWSTNTLAKRLDISITHARYITENNVRPHWGLARRIHDLSNGDVDFHELRLKGTLPTV